MFLSRLTFHTLPGKTDAVEQKLLTLAQWVDEAGGSKPRIMRTHFSSLGAPDILFEQEVQDPGTLEQQIKKVTEKKEFHKWVEKVSPLLEHSSKRELFKIIDRHRNKSVARIIRRGAATAQLLSEDSALDLALHLAAKLAHLAIMYAAISMPAFCILNPVVIDSSSVQAPQQRNWGHRAE